MMGKKRRCCNRINVKISFSLVPADGAKLRRLPPTLDSLLPLFEHLDLAGFAAKHGLVYARDGRAEMGVDVRNVDGCPCFECVVRRDAERVK